MNFRVGLPSKTAWFALLLALAGLAAVLPPSYSRWMRAPFQLFSLPQWGAVTATQALSAREQTELDRLRAENAALQRLVAQQTVWLEDLGRRTDELTRLRDQLWGERVQIVVAPVQGWDASSLRDALVVGSGSEDGIRPGCWVVAGSTLRDPSLYGAQHVLRGWFVGQVSEAQTHVSRVQLTSDPRFQASVSVLRVLADGTWQALGKTYVVTGAGQGRMRIDRCDADLLKLGYTIVALPTSPGRPAMLSIGQIVSSEPNPLSALHFDLTILPWAAAEELRHVYILVVPEL